jgi:general secretion pathway protein J
MTRDSNTQSGFTLIEVLISITLLAMLGTLIANGTRLGGRTWTNAERLTTDSDDVVLLQSLFHRAIIGARPAFASPDPRDSTIVFAGEPTALGLMVPQPGSQSTGPWVRERFYVGRSGASSALFVSFQSDAAPAAENGSVTGKPTVLLDHIARVEFGYFGPAGPGMAPAWQDSWTGRNRLPDLVRIAIVRDNAKLPIWPELIVGTRVTANAGCIFDAVTATCQRAQ